MLESLACFTGNFGSAILEHPQVQIASETTRQRVLALPAGVERVRDGFMTFSHLWTRPLAEALQVLPPKKVHQHLFQRQKRQPCWGRSDSTCHGASIGRARMPNMTWQINSQSLEEPPKVHATSRSRSWQYCMFSLPPEALSA